MEEYLQYMKTLRSQMNDVEDQAVKNSVEEQTQINTIQNLTNEIDLAKSETMKLKEDVDLMLKAKGEICSQILERQRKIALLENDSSTLSQTVELIQQERVNSSTKFSEKRTFYGKTEEEINTKLKEQQDWLNASKHSKVNKKIDHRADESTGKYDVKKVVKTGNQDDLFKRMMTKLDDAKAKFDLLKQMRSDLASESHKVNQSSEKLKCRMDDFKLEQKDMPIGPLEEELQALLSDKSGETEYQQSLQNQFDTIKGISHMIKCGCGEEYKVQVLNVG